MHLIKEEALTNEATGCAFCGRKIPKGNVFNRSTVVDGRELYTWDTCVWCLDLINHFEIYEHEDTIDYYDFITVVKAELSARGVDTADMELIDMVDLLNAWIDGENEQKYY